MIGNVSAMIPGQETSAHQSCSQGEMSFPALPESERVKREIDEFNRERLQLDKEKTECSDKITHNLRESYEAIQNLQLFLDVLAQHYHDTLFSDDLEAIRRDLNKVEQLTTECVDCNARLSEIYSKKQQAEQGMYDAQRCTYASLKQMAYDIVSASSFKLDKANTSYDRSSSVDIKGDQNEISN